MKDSKRLGYDAVLVTLYTIDTNSHLSENVGPKKG